MTRVRVGICLLFLLFGGPLGAEDQPPVVLSGESRSAAHLIADARKSLADKKWSDAIDQLQGLIDKGADDLVSLGPRQSLPSRRLAHLLLAGLPAEALEHYRNRVDAQARRGLEQGLEQRDPRPLRKVVEEAFCSRPAEKALDALGDLAFERGDFDEAESWWKMLLPAKDAPANPLATDLHYPLPTIDRTRVEAKLLLVRLFREGGPAAAPELLAYTRKNAKAEGSLAGRTGPYAAILRAVADAPRPQALDFPWPTFGGAATRGLIVPAPANVTDRLGQLCQQGGFWFSLEDRKRLGNRLGQPRVDRVHTVTRTARSLAFHPVIANGQVLVADARFVTAYDLRTGASVEWFDAAKDNGGIEPDLHLPAPADLRYTLTVAEDRVYARLGVQAIPNSNGDPLRPGLKARPPESLLVCLNFQAGPSGDRLRWKVRPSIVNDNAVFEGAPLFHGGQVYIASTRYVQDRSVTSIHCYAANTGAPCWRKDVCEARPEENRHRHHLLTMAGPNVAYCSHSGAVVALDAATGRRAWAVRYPQRPSPAFPDKEPPLTDLCPCLYEAGRLFVAPADCDRPFCLNAASGQLLWERGLRLPVVHLLGVSRAVPATPLLICTTATGLRAINAVNGSDEGGWAQPEGSGKIAPMGRGLLLGDLVLWPTELGVMSIRQADGGIVYNPTLRSNIPVGNLAYGQGCLAVADRTQLAVFVPPAWRLREREQQSRQQPVAALTLVELARSQADANHFADAAGTLDLAEKAAVKLGAEERDKIQQQIVQLRHATLLEQAATKPADEAEALLKQAAGGQFPARLRLRALKQMAEKARRQGEPLREAAVWQGILADPGLREQTEEDGLRTAAGEAREQLARLRQTHGADLLAEDEKTARECLEACKALVPQTRQQKLEQLTEVHPFTAAARTALRELGREYSEADRPGAVAHAYRRLLAAGKSSPAEEAGDLFGLARAYERQGCWEAARDVLQQLERRHGEVRRADLGNQTLREYVAERLRSPEYAGEAMASTGVLPLRRIWNRPLARDEFLLAAPLTDLVYTARPEGGQGLLLGRATKTSTPRWQCPLGFVPEWLGFHADLVLAAAEDGLACVRREDGRRLWQVHWDPSLLPGLAAHGWQLQSGRVYGMQGDRRFLVFDAETGRLLWSQWAPGGALGVAFQEGRFHPGYRVLGDTVLLQTATGRRWLIESATGRFRHDAPTDRTAWPKVIVDTQVGSGPIPCLVSEEGRIVRLDPIYGTEMWSWALPGQTQLTGEPVQVRVTPRGILVLTPTNIGQQLQRLDPATGKALWERGAILTTDVLDLSAWSLDSKGIYLVRDQTLQAYGIEEGKVLWEQTLAGPQGRWRTLLVPKGSPGNVLLVYPEAIPARVWEFSWLFGSLQWIVGKAPEGRSGQGCPIHCCDPATGQVIQRLNLPAGLPCLHAPRSARLVGPKVLPALRTTQTLHPTTLSIGVGPGGLVAILAGQLWGFQPMLEKSGTE